jgi:membrane protease YdiL (CAAX protease family)
MADARPAPPPPRAPRATRFNPVVTVASAALLLALSLTILSLGGPADPGQLRYPAESAGRIIDRHQNFFAGYEQVPDWQRRVFSALFGERAAVGREGVAVYREVLEYLEAHPERATPWALLNTRARLLVLLAELGEHEAFEAELARLGESPEELAVAEALAFAYASPGAPQRLSPIAIAGLRLLPLGYTSDQLWLRAAQRELDTRRIRHLERRLEASGAGTRSRTLVFALLSAALITLGLVLAVWRPGRRETRWRAQALEQPWGLDEGFAVLVRAGALGLLIYIGIGAISGSMFKTNMLALWSTLFASLPMLWLIHRRLLAPRGLSYATAFGLQLGGLPGLRRLAIATVVVLAIEQLGALLIAWGSWRLGLEAHWAEGLPERLIWSPWNTTLLGSLNTVAWGPVLEEIGFRGLLYITLRSRLGPLAAAGISAGVFAGAHLYSAAAALTVFWSGMVWAVAFERLRSLLPVMLAHIGANLFAVATVLSFYR